jgi:hypothetical protein
MVELNQGQLIAISVSCAVVILVVGLVVTLVLTQRASAKSKDGGAVVPPVNPDAPIQPVRTQICAPFSTARNDFQLVPCDSQAKCNGCVEFTDVSSQYSCVAVTGGNGMVTSAGQLVHPLEVTFKVPPSSPPKSCYGHGKLNKDGTCKCDDGYSGENCNITRMAVTTPGSYCLPAYAQVCDTATTESVLVNEAGGKGGQYECQCKPEYKGMFTQAVQGGPCDVPLICDAASPQLESNLEDVKMYSVYANKYDSQGDPLFVQQPVFTNKVAAPGAPTVECVAQVTPPSDGCEGVDAAHCKPYKQAVVAPDADPTCQPVLRSNKCTSSFATKNDTQGMLLTIRGSNKPGDPLKKRVYPAYYPPVPPALQRCPDGYLGNNTPSSPCHKKEDKSKVLKFKPSIESKCVDDSQVVNVNDPASYGPDWYDAVFTDDGEWNGYFTCMADLTTARVLVNGTDTAVQDDAMKWATVKGRTVNEVDCNEGKFSTWRMRGKKESDPPSVYCRGKSGCLGVKGFQHPEWDGYQNGDLMDGDGNPWFAVNGTSAALPRPTFGGQCSCQGVTYREGVKDGKPVLVPTPMAPGYMMQNTGTENWWSCLVDTCWTPETPEGHLQQDGDATFTHPHCECNSGKESAGLPYSTHMSYRPTGQSPTCVRDSCNPGGVRTTSDLFCSPNDTVNKCQGVCYSDNRCYIQTGNSCKDDSECVNKVTPSLTGVCKKGKDEEGKEEEKGMCMYKDPDRASSHCDGDGDCSYGLCTNMVTLQVRQSNGAVVPITQGTCSGGCACDIEYVQRPDQSTPLGYTCKKRCEVTPCVAANTKEPCSVNRETGEQVCVCKSPCFEQPRCARGNNMSQLGERCFDKWYPAPKDYTGPYGFCCEGTCGEGFCAYPPSAPS